MKSTILEVALNGPWSRELQPGMPITTQELIADGIACAKAGASVVHVHVYDPETGRQYENFDAYRAVIEGIRAVEDVILYPTLPLSGSPDAPSPMPPAARFAVMEALAKAGLIEWAVIDPGSTQFTRYDQIATKTPGFLYQNPEPDLIYGLDKADEFGVRPSYAIYEPGFLRLGFAHANLRSGLPKPIYRFMFSDGFTFGFPPEPYALDAYRCLLQDTDPLAEWMIAGLHVDITPLIPDAVRYAGHVRVGLEDAPFGSQRGNTDWVETAANAIEKAGGTVATAQEIRINLA